MDAQQIQAIQDTRQAAVEVLLNNLKGPFRSLPRTAAWGYPEPYTRDLMISSLGFLVSGNQDLRAACRETLIALAENQSPRGQIPSLVHDPKDLGSSDTTPLFLFGVGIYRMASGEVDFLEKAVLKALIWMEFQSPEEDFLVYQLPTSDWRDEQWVLGYGLYVNILVNIYRRLFHQDLQAKEMHRLLEHIDLRLERMHHKIHEGLSIADKPYFALWAYKLYNNERFDLLGNSLAILSGIASPERSRKIARWVEDTCAEMRGNGDLRVLVPPCLMPYILPGDSDWYPRLERFNPPGSYHNGGIWPFVTSFYIAALIGAGERELAEEKLLALTELVRSARNPNLPYGFNEWYQAQTGEPMGQDWQTWSAAMYLYAAETVQQNHTPFFKEIRNTISIDEYKPEIDEGIG